MHKLALTFIAIAMLASSGCYSRMGDLSMISNRNVSTPLDKTKRVTGKDCAYVIFFIPFGRPDLEAAVDDALDRDTQSQLLSDAVVERGHEGIGLVGRNCIAVTGTLAKPAQ